MYGQSVSAGSPHMQQEQKTSWRKGYPRVKVEEWPCSDEDGKISILANWPTSMCGNIWLFEHKDSCKVNCSRKPLVGFHLVGNTKLKYLVWVHYTWLFAHYILLLHLPSLLFGLIWSWFVTDTQHICCMHWASWDPVAGKQRQGYAWLAVCFQPSLSRINKVNE